MVWYASALAKIQQIIITVWSTSLVLIRCQPKFRSYYLFGLDFNFFLRVSSNKQAGTILKFVTFFCSNNLWKPSKLAKLKSLRLPFFSEYYVQFKFKNFCGVDIKLLLMQGILQLNDFFKLIL